MDKQRTVIILVVAMLAGSVQAGSIVGPGAEIPDGNDFVAIAPGFGHVLALKSDGSVVGWGLNNYGQATPPDGNDFVAVAAGRYHSLALKNNGSILAWGYNTSGQATPPDGNDFVEIAAGPYHNLALRANGSIIGWGRNRDGQAAPPQGNDFVALAAGWYHGLALRSDGSIAGWGRDDAGQATSPPGSDFVAVAAGAAHSLALRIDGSVVGWGLDDHGQATPHAGNGFVAIAAGQAHSLALRIDGSIVSWGNQTNTFEGNRFVAIATYGGASYAIEVAGDDPADTYGGGSGTREDPYQIWEASHMQAIGTDPCDWDKHFVLMADIDLGSYVEEDFNIIGYYGSSSDNRPFTGVFDGNDYTISNFTYHSDDRDCIGLFGYVEGADAEIKDLSLVGPDIDAGAGLRVGSLVGLFSKGAITNCRIEGGDIAGGQLVGGLCGDSTGTLSNCSADGGSVAGEHSVGVLTGSNSGTATGCHATGSVIRYGRHAGGLVGYNSGSIENCYAMGSVTGDGLYAGGLVGSNYGIITNCYSTGSIIGNGRYAGGLVGANSMTIANCYATGLVTGAESIGGLVGQTSRYVVSSYWNSDSGSPDNDIGIPKTSSDMTMADTFANWGFCGVAWTIEEGVDYPRLLWESRPGEPITGTFPLEGNGDSNSPYLICTPEELNTIGLIPCLWDRKFKLTADIDLNQYAGNEFNVIAFFKGVFDGNGHTISNLTCNGGFFDYVDDPNAEVRNLGLIDPNTQGACLAAVLRDGNIINCYAEGGIVEGSGGLIGSNYGTLTKCYFAGNVIGGFDVGGLVSANGGVITDCYSAGSVDGGRPRIGGLAGYNSGTIADSHSTAAVSGSDDTAGLVGLNEGTITRCYSTGRVRSSDDFGVRMGGLVAYNYEGSSIIQCYSTSSVSLYTTRYNGYAGGLVGFNSGSIDDCYATGNSGGTNDYGNAYVGGLVGVNWDSGTITTSYSSGRVGASYYGAAGGLVGDNLGIDWNCFWDIETSKQSDSAGGWGLNTEDMKQQSSFWGWDFTTTWDICEGISYPRLQWQIPSADLTCPYGVSLSDFSILGTAWQSTPTDANWDATCDLDGDEYIGAGDLAIACDHWMRGI